MLTVPPPTARVEARPLSEAQKVEACKAAMLAIPPLTARVEAHLLSEAQKVEARKAAMLAVPPPTRRVQLLGQLNCDWVTQGCVRKTETPDSCTQCNRPVHFECQLSWKRNAELFHEKKCTSQGCCEYHPEYQHWREVHRKPVAEQEKEARAKEALNSCVWARLGEHKGAVVHQCQLLDRIAEKRQVWVKWTSTGNIMCISKSNLEEPTQGRE